MNLKQSHLSAVLMHDLDPIDPVLVQDVLSKPPFVTVPGVINIRDLGNLPSTTHPGKVTRPKLMFRSAELSGVKDEGEWHLSIISDVY